MILLLQFLQSFSENGHSRDWCSSRPDSAFQNCSTILTTGIAGSSNYWSLDWILLLRWLNDLTAIQNILCSRPFLSTFLYHPQISLNMTDNWQVHQCASSKVIETLKAGEKSDNRVQGPRCHRMPLWQLWWIASIAFNFCLCEQVNLECQAQSPQFLLRHILRYFSSIAGSHASFIIIADCDQISPTKSSEAWGVTGTPWGLIPFHTALW